MSPGRKPVTARGQKGGRNPYWKEGEAHPLGDPLHPTRAPALREVPEVSTASPDTQGDRLGVPSWRREREARDDEWALVDNRLDPPRESAIRRQGYHWKRLEEATTPADALYHGFRYLNAIAMDRQKADKIAVAEAAELVVVLLNGAAAAAVDALDALKTGRRAQEYRSMPFDVPTRGEGQ